MGKYDFIKIKKKLSKYLDEARFEHTMGVMYTCAALAMVYDYDLEDAQAAGLLHDSAKCIPNKKKLKICAEHHIPVSDFEKEHPFLLHAKLGAYIAKAKYMCIIKSNNKTRKKRKKNGKDKKFDAYRNCGCACRTDLCCDNGGADTYAAYKGLCKLW